MATLTFSLDTGDVPLDRIVGAICSEYGYSPTVPVPPTLGADGKPVPPPLDAGGNPIPQPTTRANPVGPKEFAVSVAAQVVQNIVLAYERRVAQAAANAATKPIELTPLPPAA